MLPHIPQHDSLLRRRPGPDHPPSGRDRTPLVPQPEGPGDRERVGDDQEAVEAPHDGHGAGDDGEPGLPGRGEDAYGEECSVWERRPQPAFPAEYERAQVEDVGVNIMGRYFFQPRDDRENPCVGFGFSPCKRPHLTPRQRAGLRFTGRGSYSPLHIRPCRVEVSVRQSRGREHPETRA
ncbi:hypothetical protein LZ30DRAFT_710190 [Colletotrichum cereale]|nr:hypothetical protein LZ30DRAFT_710190 [Colletotrichum cereale]